MGIHLIKANHSITEGRKPLTTLPQIFPVGLTEAFIQPLDRKAKTKGKMPATVCSIRKPNLLIGGLILKNSSSQSARLASPLRPSPAIDSSLSTFTAHFLFRCESSSVVCFPLSTRGVDSKGSTKVTGSSLTL